AQFKEGVEDIAHLEQGMILEGVVSNVTNFGAFVDIGVHQDGLVHISAMTNRFITDPRAVVKAGDIVTVKVVDIDKERKRIGLSMKLNDEAPAPAAKKPQREAAAKKPVDAKRPDTRKKPEAKKAEPVKKAVFNTAMADALAKLKRGG
ncbi:MAG: S1 RNA-binding domain-containing protein, partial [Legionella sp.]